MNFNTANSTFRQLLGNGLTYHVPPFQRDYSWGIDEWDDLWQDIVALIPRSNLELNRYDDRFYQTCWVLLLFLPYPPIKKSLFQRYDPNSLLFRDSSIKNLPLDDLAGIAPG